MLRNALSLFMIAIFLMGCSRAEPETTEDDGLDNATLFINATVITMNEDQPSLGAMLVHDGKIIAVGSDAVAGVPLNKKSLTTIDMRGKTILPGIIDSHVHVRELGMDAVKADLVGTTDTNQMVERLQAKFSNPVPGEWLIGQGWDEGAFASMGYPDRAALDAAFPDNPIALESLHGFAGFYNGMALKIAGVTAETANPEAGTILKRDDGEPTGVMLALGQGLINPFVPSPNIEQRKTAILAGLNTMAAAGVTSIHEAGMTPQDVTAFTQLADEGALPVRVFGMLDGNDETLMMQWFEKGPLDHPSSMLDIASIKVFYDGSLGSRTAVLAEPYSDHPEKAAMAERISLEKMTSLAQRAAKMGFQMAVHAIGDEGNRRVMDIYQTTLAEHPELDPRWRIEHAQVVLPDFYQEAAALNVIVSMQPSHAVGDSGWAEDRVGNARIKHAYAWQRMLAAGVPLIFNSDLPGEPWKPMETLYFAVTRQKLDGTPIGGWYSDQALSVEQSLYAMTAANAYAAFQERELGQLKAGMRADFIILDENPMQEEASKIPMIAVQETWVGGAPVWQAAKPD